MTRALLTLSALLVGAAVARADLPPPWRPGVKHVEVTHRIETREDLQDYVFLVVHSSAYGANFRINWVQLESSLPLTLQPSGGYRASARLLVIPKVAAERYSTAEALLAAANEKQIPIVLQEQFDFSAVAVPSWGKSNKLIAHEIRRPAPGGLEIVRTSWNQMWQWYVVVLFLSLTIITSGMCLIQHLLCRVQRRCKSAGGASASGK